jgi:hypothetical protein
MSNKSFTWVITLAVLAGCSDHALTANPVSYSVGATPQRAAQTGLLTNIPVSETNFTGWFSITHLAYDEHARRVLFSGTVTRASDGRTDTFSDVPGTLIRAATARASDATVMPAQAGTQGPCNVLTLAIQPLSLDVMGLTLTLSIIRLDLDAVTGPGRSLGNLLCAVAGLLDSGAESVRAIQQRLERINRMLATS